MVKGNSTEESVGFEYWQSREDDSLDSMIQKVTQEEADEEEDRDDEDDSDQEDQDSSGVGQQV